MGRLDLIDPRRDEDEPLEPLALSERKVLFLASQGLNAEESGKAMHLSKETVKTYRRRAFMKLPARNIAEAVAKAVRWKLIP